MKKKKHQKRIAIVLIISIILSVLPVFPVSAEVFHGEVHRSDSNPNEPVHTRPTRPSDPPSTETPVRGYTLLNDGTYKLMYDNDTATEITVPDRYLSKDVTVIGDNAYTGNTTTRTITVPRTITNIGSFAFANCTALQTVVIQNAETQIGTGVFEGCQNVTLKCPGHSAAESYAIENNISYEIFDINDTLIYLNYNEYNDYEIFVDVWTRDGVQLEKDVDYTYQYTVDWNKMISYFKIEGIGQYSGSYSETAEVQPKFDIQYQTIDLEQNSYVYDGTAKRPKVSVYTICQDEEDPIPDAGDGEDFTLPRSAPVGASYKYLTEGKDYEVEYTNNVNAGTASVIITGKRLYMGTVVKNFTIANNSLSSASVTLSNTSYTYDGTEKKPSVTVKLGSKTLSENVDYSLRYNNNVAAGTASAVVEGKGSYAGTITKQFTISKRNLTSVEARLSENTFTYDGKAKTPDLILSFGSFTLDNGKDYTLSYSNNTAVGTATVTATGKGNFTGSVSKNFTIKQNIRPISDCTITLSSYSYTYDGTNKEPSVTVKYGSTVLTSSSYSVTYSQNKNVGTASVTVTGKGNYTGEAVITFTISPKALASGMLTNNTGTKTYDGYEKYPDFTLTDSGKRLTQNADYETSYSDNLNAGKAKASIRGIGNYSGSLSLEYTISPHEIRDGYDIVALSQIKYEYDGTAKEPVPRVRALGKDLIQGKDFTVSYSSNTQVGTGYATIKGIGNFSGTVRKPFTISGKQISEKLDIILSETSYLYDGANHKPSVTVSYKPNLNADSVRLTNGTDYDVTYDSDCKSAGKHHVTVTCKNNYSGTKTVDYTIEKRHIASANATLSQTEYTYDETEKKPTVTVKLNSTALKQGTDYTVDYYDNAKPGTARAVVKGIGNFYGEKTMEFTITKALSPFAWGVDNWSFNNSSKYFTEKFYINNSILTKFKNNFNVTERDIENMLSWMKWKNKPKSEGGGGGWHGSCYGMTSTEMLVKYGTLDLSYYGLNKNVNKNIALENTTGQDVISLINCFQVTQSYSSLNPAIRKQAFMNNVTQYNYISGLESYLNSGTRMLNLFFSISQEFTHDCVVDGVSHKKGSYDNLGNHSILAYGIETLKTYYHSDVTGLDYDKKILIADPNALKGNQLNDYYCIYYRSSDHSWIKPDWCGRIDNNRNAVCYWNNFGSLGIQTGEIYGLYDYKNGLQAESIMDNTSINHYIAGLEITNSKGENAEVDVIEVGSSNLAYSGTDESDKGIKKYDYTLVLDQNYDENTENFALWNPKSTYSASYQSNVAIDLNMDYEDVSYYATLSNGNYSNFAPDGYINVEGDNTSYEIAMVTNGNVCVTDWYKLTVKGDNVNQASLRKTEGGYILTADNLNNVTISAKNLDVNTSCQFSANAKSAYIYEININTIGVKADTDGDGTFETEVSIDHIGDANGDNRIDVKDVTAIQRHVAEIAYLNKKQRLLADVNNDGVVNIDDATHLQMHLAEFGVVLG